MILTLSSWTWLLGIGAASITWRWGGSRPWLGIILPGDFLRFPPSDTVPRFGGKDAVNLIPASTTGCHGDVAHCCLHGFVRPGVSLWQGVGGSLVRFPEFSFSWAWMLLPLMSGILVRMYLLRLTLSFSHHFFTPKRKTVSHEESPLSLRFFSDT